MGVWFYEINGKAIYVMDFNVDYSFSLSETGVGAK